MGIPDIKTPLSPELIARLNKAAKTIMAIDSPEEAAKLETGEIVDKFTTITHWGYVIAKTVLSDYKLTDYYKEHKRWFSSKVIFKLR
jgi:hypothetical protein